VGGIAHGTRGGEPKGTKQQSTTEAIGPGRSGGVKGLPKAARVRPRALDAENDLVALKEQGNTALLCLEVTLIQL
jgi:hypothetical protein